MLLQRHATIDNTMQQSLIYLYRNHFNTDAFLEGECYGKLAVSIRPVKNHIRIPAKLANLGGQVQVGTIMAKVTKFGETSFWEYEKRRSEVCNYFSSS
jgi:hypothetical protein